MSSRSNKDSQCLPSAYAYTSLGEAPKAIRLLLVEPGLRNDAIHCTLLSADLNELPKPIYETISYCWGNATSRDELILEGHLFSVPATSAAAIRRMRYEDSPRTLWIDAICIDQRNISERNRQVPLMKHIYSQSSGNLIYLGEPDGSEAEAFSNIDAIWEEAKADTTGFAEMLVSDEPIDITPKGLKTKVDMDALYAFYSKSWFSRVWVVQEVVLAPTNTCFCGNFSRPLVSIYAAAGFLWYNHKDKELPHKFTVLIETCLEMLGLVDRSGEVANFANPQAMSMLEILRIQRGLHATDPRDHIYGMLGLYSPSSSPSESVLLPENLLDVDYDKPAAVIMGDATRIAFSEAAEDVDDVLWKVSHRSREEINDTWPSWLPKWDRDPDLSLDPLSLSGSLFESSAGVSISLDLLAATKGTNLLCVNGIGVSEISAYSSELVEDVAFYAAEYLPWLEQVTSMAGSASADVGLTLIAGTMDGDSRSSVDVGESLQTLMEFLREKGELPNSVAEGDASSETLALYDGAICKAARSRRFLVTASGQIGIGPKMMGRGDIVAILYGSRVPCVLRRFGGYYWFIGMCYVHGIMDGEAVKEHQAAGKPDEIFTLC